ncbi:MAG: type II toxin-antitoxin system VapC family toxin [Myxococcota bacterium]|nr:type II toxin-antitoxin system VapC family toxin [Myxococcota bacterium]
MKLLLDTHIFLWSLLKPQKLSREVARELESETSELWLSPITTWEVSILAEKGRISLRDAPFSWIRQVLKTVAFIEAPMNHEVALRSREISLEHQDPADRFLAATAIVYDLTLVTSDERLLKCSEIQTLPNL